MTIKGLSDRGLSFPEIGQLRKGAAKTANTIGADLKFFRVTFDEKEIETATIFKAKYGDQPDEINIILPFDDIERMWDSWLEAYSAGRMIARSDGEYYTYLVDYKTGEILVRGGIDVKTNLPRAYHDKEPLGFWHNSRTNKDEPIICRPVGRLKVIIPELARAAYLTVLTTSIHDIINISAQLEAFKRVNGGRIAGIPLVLRRRPKKISTPNADGTRARREKWLISIEADPRWVKNMLEHTKRLALPEPEEVIESELVEEEDWDPDQDAGNTQPAQETIATPEAESGKVPEGANQEGSTQAAAGLEGNHRPWTAEVFKSKFAQAIEIISSNKWAANEVDRNMVAANLEACFAGDPSSKDKRKTIMKFLVGKISTKELTDAEVLAFKRWLDAQPDSGGAWKPNAHSIQEAVAAYAAALKAEGQQEIPF